MKIRHRCVINTNHGRNKLQVVPAGDKPIDTIKTVIETHQQGGQTSAATSQTKNKIRLSYMSPTEKEV
jgi:hypothetical protein